MCGGGYVKVSAETKEMLYSYNITLRPVPRTIFVTGKWQRGPTFSPTHSHKPLLIHIRITTNRLRHYHTLTLHIRILGGKQLYTYRDADSGEALGQVQGKWIAYAMTFGELVAAGATKADIFSIKHDLKDQV